MVGTSPRGLVIRRRAPSRTRADTLRSVDGALNDAVARLLAVTADELLITQTELERRTGISQSLISKLFRGERRMSLDQFSALCTALRVSPVAVVASAMQET